MRFKGCCCSAGADRMEKSVLLCYTVQLWGGDLECVCLKRWVRLYFLQYLNLLPWHVKPVQQSALIQQRFDSALHTF